MNKYLNCHFFFNHAPSALNCDETGTPKTAMVGGRERARVSSQAVKSPVRRSPLFHEKFGQPSCRTRSVAELADYILGHMSPEWGEVEYDKAVVDLVVSAGMKPKTTTAWMPAEIRAMLDAVYAVMRKYKKTPDDVAKLGFGTGSFTTKEKEKADEESDAETSKEVSAAEAEMHAAINAESEAKAEARAKGSKKSGGKDGKQKDKKPKTPFEIELVEAVQKASAQIAASGYCSMDVAFFGRMCASGALKEVNGAVSVMHAFSTHEIIMDTDYFTVADDLKYRGAGHIGDKDFLSCTLYLYVSVNVGQLARNLGISMRAAMKKAAALPEIIAKTFPSGKQNSYASQPMATYIMTEVLDSRLSLHEAFEEPVQAGPLGGYAKPSVVALENFWDGMHRMGHAENGHTAVLTVYNTTSRFCKDYAGTKERLPGTELARYSDMEKWICDLAELESDTPEI